MRMGSLPLNANPNTVDFQMAALSKLIAKSSFS
jgi:hypothetical protein